MDRVPLQPDQPLDCDVRCAGPGCGYNLRGLVGDPIRCPECGATVTRAMLRARLAGHRRALEIQGELHRAGLLAAIPIGVFVAIGVAVLIGGASQAAVCAFTGGLLLWSMILVPPIGYAFRDIEGAWRTLLHHQAYMVVVVAVSTLAVIGVCWAAVVVLNEAGAVIVLVGGVVAVFTVNPMRWLARRAFRLLAPLAAAMEEKEADGDSG